MVPDVKQVKQLPEGWEFNQLSSLFQERRETSSDLEKYPLYSLTIEEGLIEKPERYNREFLLKNRQDNQYRLVYPGDFVFNPMNLRWGAIAMSSLSKPVTVSAYYNVLSLDSSIIPSNLLLTILQSPQMLNAYDTVGKGTLVEKKRVHLNVFLKLKIPVPPITQSKKIDAILSSVDEAIASTQAVIDQTRKVKQGLLQQLLTRGIGHTKFKESAIGKIPVEWQCQKLSSLVSFVTSGSRGWASYYSESGALFLRITNLNRNSIILNLTDTRYVSLPENVSEGQRTRLNPGDILISITADLGKVAVVPPEGIGEAYVNQHISLVRPVKLKVIPEFLGYALTSPIVQSQFLALNDPGAKAGFNLSSIRNLRVPIPPLLEQQNIVDKLNSFNKYLENTSKELFRLNQLKQGLIQDLLTGRVRVGGTP
jgi:type I restriction enzyme S subunit